MERLDAGACLSGVEGMEHEQVGQGSLNISDVIEVIQTTDPEFADASYRMFSGGGSSMEDTKQKAYVKILEQPASKALRFRYECEGRSAGSIPGVNSTPESKTFPSIQIVGYKGRAVVVVSCVTKDPPYRPHPHNLVGKEGCKKGVCTVEITSESMAVTFSNLGIQCVKKKDIDDALKVREEIRVDPFRTGFSHRSQPTSIDLNAVRLCFQVFLEGSERGKFTFQLPPVVSDPIFDKKAMSDLVICKLSECSATVAGGKEIILLCEKVAKEDIQVRFYEEQNGVIVWEGYGDFQPTHVHKQVAISFRAPRYRSIEVNNPVKVNIQLRRPSDGATSESLPFEFVPIDSERRRKMPKPLLAQFQDRDKTRAYPQPEQKPILHVKREPIDSSVPPGHMFVGNTSPMYGLRTSPSPQPHQAPTPKTTQTPSPSPHSMGRTPSPMDYRFPPQFQGNVAVYDTFGGTRLPDGMNVSLVPGLNVGIMPGGGGIVNRLGQDVLVQGNNNLSHVRQFPQGIVVQAHNPVGGIGTMNLQVGPSHSDPNVTPRLTTMNLPSPGMVHSPSSTNPSPSPGLVCVTNLPPGPRAVAPPVQGIGNVASVPGLEEGNILDLDRHQYSLTPLDSGDLYDLNLSENLSNYLSLSENQQHQQQIQQQQHHQQIQQHLQQQQQQQQQQQFQQLQQQMEQQQTQERESQENMTDSFTRLTTEICNLNEMFKGGGRDDN